MLSITGSFYWISFREMGPWLLIRTFIASYRFIKFMSIVQRTPKLVRYGGFITLTITFIIFYNKLKSRGTLKRKASKRNFTYHLYFCMRDFGQRIGDDAEIFFFLYDGNPGRMRPLSERFLVRISKDGFSNYVEKLHSNCTVFIDLGKFFID